MLEWNVAEISPAEANVSIFQEFLKYEFAIYGKLTLP